jgi:hypothetical protein
MYDCTFLRQSSPSVMFELIIIPCALDSGIAPCSRKRKLHRLVEELEALYFFDSSDGRLVSLEYDECLTLSLQVGLGDNFDDVAIFGENRVERLLERLWLDAFLEVADVNAAQDKMVSRSASKARDCMCRSAMTHT